MQAFMPADYRLPPRPPSVASSTYGAMRNQFIDDEAMEDNEVDDEDV
jgi:hypothetical protein